MERKFLAMVLLMALSVAVAQAQSASRSGKDRNDRIKFTGGAMSEANLTNFLCSGIGHARSKTRAGVNVGGFLHMGFSGRFSVQGEMLFNYRTSGFQWEAHGGHYRYLGVEIPIYGMCHWEFRKSGYLYIGVGPYTNFGFEAFFKEGGRKENLYKTGKGAGVPAMKDSDTGFAFKLGYEFASGLQLNAAYKVSMTDVADANSGVAELRPQSFSFGIAYRWGK